MSIGRCEKCGTSDYVHKVKDINLCERCYGGSPGQLRVIYKSYKISKKFKCVGCHWYSHTSSNSFDSELIFDNVNSIDCFDKLRNLNFNNVDDNFEYRSDSKKYWNRFNHKDVNQLNFDLG